MPIHDWTRVDAGVFHGFHLRWIASITTALNNGGLPLNYYADSEQYAATKEADVLTLTTSDDPFLPTNDATPDVRSGGVAVVETATLAHRIAKRSPRPKPRQRRIAVRHVTGHRVIAFLEIVSPGNKDRRAHAIEFASKVQNALEQGIHVTVLDLFPPTRATPRGLHSEIWRQFDRERIEPAPGRPLVLSAFVAKAKPEIYFETSAVGQELSNFPLYIGESHGVPLPLAETYAAAFAGSPPYLRELLSQTPGA